MAVVFGGVLLLLAIDTTSQAGREPFVCGVSASALFSSIYVC